MPPGMRHFAGTTGETVLLLHGTGPWKINYVNPADDPRKPKAIALSGHCCEVSMKRYAGVFSAIVLVAIAAVSCAQSSDKGSGLSATVGPELRWKYETGG